MLQSTTTLNAEQIGIELNFASWLAANGNRGQGHSDRSIDAHISDLRQFIHWFEPHAGQSFSPELITNADLRAYYSQTIKVEQRTGATWNRRRISLALFCKFAHETGMVVYNPFQGVPRVERGSQKPRSLSKTDYARFLRTIEQSVNTARTPVHQRKAIRNRALVALLIYAGIRVGEVVELRRDQLTLSDRKGQVKVLGKRNREDYVPLGREARLALSQWLEISTSEKLFEGITSRQAQRIVKELGEKAGLQDIDHFSSHCCRHTFCRRVTTSSDLATAQKLARHSRTDQTQRYALPSDDEMQEVVEDL